ncbi:LOW QUALITY PROTEIN: growth/differentiation factor 11, partial [Vespula squamosa]
MPPQREKASNGSFAIRHHKKKDEKIEGPFLEPPAVTTAKATVSAVATRLTGATCGAIRENMGRIEDGFTHSHALIPPISTFLRKERNRHHEEISVSHSLLPQKREEESKKESRLLKLPRSSVPVLSSLREELEKEEEDKEEIAVTVVQKGGNAHREDAYRHKRAGQGGVSVKKLRFEFEYARDILRDDDDDDEETGPELKVTRKAKLDCVDRDRATTGWWSPISAGITSPTAEHAKRKFLEVKNVKRGSHVVGKKKLVLCDKGGGEGGGGGSGGGGGGEGGGGGGGEGGGSGGCGEEEGGEESGGERRGRRPAGRKEEEAEGEDTEAEEALRVQWKRKEGRKKKKKKKKNDVVVAGRLIVRSRLRRKAASDASSLSGAMHEEIRALSLEAIKEQILNKLGLKQAPNMTGRALPRIPAISKLMDMYGMQADQPQPVEPGITHHEEVDEYAAKTESVFALAQP